LEKRIRRKKRIQKGSNRGISGVKWQNEGVRGPTPEACPKKDFRRGEATKNSCRRTPLPGEEIGDNGNFIDPRRGMRIRTESGKEGKKRRKRRSCEKGTEIEIGSCKIRKEKIMGISWGAF